MGSFGAFEGLGFEPVLPELAEQDRVSSLEHAELVHHLLELPPDLDAANVAQAPRSLDEHVGPGEAVAQRGVHGGLERADVGIGSEGLARCEDGAASTTITAPG